MKLSAPRLVWLYHRSHQEHPFILLSLRTLSEQGWQVRVIDNADVPVEADYEHLPFWHGYHNVLLTLLCLPIFVPKWRKYIHKRLRQRLTGFQRYIDYPISLVWHTLRFRPNTVVACLPFEGWLGWMAARLCGARLVYYSFELYGEQMVQLPAYAIPAEKQLLRRVDAFITQNEKRAEFYQQQRGVRVTPTIIHNYKRARSMPAPGRLRETLSLPDTTRIVLYEGYMMAGRNLDCVIQSAAFLPDDVRLVFIGGSAPSKWWNEALAPLLELPEIRGKVSYLEAVPHDELLRYVVDADVGIVIYDDQVLNNYYCEPGKLSDYVLADVPVIAPNFPTIAPIIAQYNIGATFADASPPALAETILSVLATPGPVWTERLAAARQIVIWETQIPTLLQTLMLSDVPA